MPRLLRAPIRAGGQEHTENPRSLAGTGVLRAMKDAAQALGLRPWLAALPLRERRLRARLLMCAPNGLYWPGRAEVLLWHIIDPRGLPRGRPGLDRPPESRRSRVGVARGLPCWSGEGITAPDLVIARQIDVNRRKLTLSAVRRIQFSPLQWREGHTHILLWFRDC